MLNVTNFPTFPLHFIFIYFFNKKIKTCCVFPDLKIANVVLDFWTHCIQYIVHIFNFQVSMLLVTSFSLENSQICSGRNCES